MPPGGASAVGGGEDVAVELLDEYWCYRNVLSGRAVGIPERSLPPAGGIGGGPPWSDATEKAAAAAAGCSAEEAPGVKSPVCRSLLRTPSLPPRIGKEKPTEDEGACPHKSGGGPKLRHSYSNLENVLLFSPGGGRQHNFSPKNLAAHCGAPRHRPPRLARVESIIRYVDGHHRAITGESSWRRAFQVKKWRSLGDLETEEVQGFKDLGFVFDGAAVSPGVLEVVPGLRRAEGAGCGGEGEGKKVRRPYLSEAWPVQGSALPALDWVGGSSAADVKEQLRFWARVVASNVRQEC